MWTAGNDLKGASQQTQVLSGQVEQKEPEEQWKDRVQWEVRADHTWYKEEVEKCLPKCQRCTECVGLGKLGLCHARCQVRLTASRQSCSSSDCLVRERREGGNI